jgi:SAM-dependent methyltransferase
MSFTVRLKVTSIEPGAGYQTYWETHGIVVVNDFFPSHQVSGKFDAIVFYTVLEHIKDTKAFLNSVKQQLRPKGRIFLAVPDCTIEILAHDPSILLHEHFHYFTAISLANTLAEVGFIPIVEPSRYGRSLFAIGTPGIGELSLSDTSECLSQFIAFISDVPRVRYRLYNSFASWLEKGVVGVYCPSRLLNIIPVRSNVLFYDDAPEIQGKYYPPFPVQVGDRKKLFSDLPRTLLIGSRTFGSKLKADLIRAGLSSNILLLDNLVPNVQFLAGD